MKQKVNALLFFFNDIRDVCVSSKTALRSVTEFGIPIPPLIPDIVNNFYPIAYVRSPSHIKVRDIQNLRQTCYALVVSSQVSFSSLRHSP